MLLVLPARPNGPAAVPSCAPWPCPTPAGQSCPIAAPTGRARPAQGRGDPRPASAACPAGPRRAPRRRPALPWRDTGAPGAPRLAHLTSLGSLPVSLRIFSSTCLRLSLAFSSCSCSARTATAIPPAARPGRAPREAALGNRGDRPRPLRRPRARTAQPIAPRWPPLTANHRARGEGGTPARVARQKRSPITEPRGRLASRPPN